MTKRTTRDLSVAMIGCTVRVERDRIAGTHNYLEGRLEDFTFSTETVCSYASEPIRILPVDLRATIAGLPIDLRGSEPLTVLDWEAS